MTEGERGGIIKLMINVVTFLFDRFFYRIGDFFHHWYYHGSRRLGHIFLAFFEKLDITLALKITLKHFFKPLYQDYTVVGRFLGLIFRLIRILIGVLIYVFFGIIFAATYALWVLVLPALFFLIVADFYQ